MYMHVKVVKSCVPRGKREESARNGMFITINSIVVTAGPGKKLCAGGGRGESKTCAKGYAAPAAGGSRQEPRAASAPAGRGKPVAAGAGRRDAGPDLVSGPGPPACALLRAAHAPCDTASLGRGPRLVVSFSTCPSFSLSPPRRARHTAFLQVRVLQ